MSPYFMVVLVGLIAVGMNYLAWFHGPKVQKFFLEIYDTPRLRNWIGSIWYLGLFRMVAVLLLITIMLILVVIR